VPVRCAIVPPAPAPYREPLFRALHERDDLELRVIYQSAHQPSWDLSADWFTGEHPYPALHLRSWQRGRPGRTPVVWPRGLERALRCADPDCVVATEYGPASLRAMAWCRRHGRAYVVFSDCTPQINPMLSPTQLRLHRWVARHADAMITVSSAGRERLLAFGVPSERIAVALQSGDLEPVRAAAAAASAPSAPSAPSAATPGPDEPRPLTILSVGRLVPDKNFATLIEAVAQAGLAERAQLVIAGTGPLEPELRALARRTGVAVQLHGYVAPAEMPRLYAAADIFALVSTYEPFGVSIREAVAAGLPIIASRDAGAAGDIAIARRNALLIDPYRVQEVSDALQQLASDGAVRRRMATESRAIDEATDHRDVEPYAAAVISAARRRGR
jgi:glycosyltransferase involved in cell wall biosynthesis